MTGLRPVPVHCLAIQVPSPLSPTFLFCGPQFTYVISQTPSLSSHSPRGFTPSWSFRPSLTVSSLHLVHRLLRVYNRSQSFFLLLRTNTIRRNLRRETLTGCVPGRRIVDVNHPSRYGPCVTSVRSGGSNNVDLSLSVWPPLPHVFLDPWGRVPRIRQFRIGRVGVGRSFTDGVGQGNVSRNEEGYPMVHKSTGARETHGRGGVS